MSHPTFTFLGNEVYLQKDQYRDGTTAVIVKECEPEYEYDDIWATLTASSIEAKAMLGEGEIAVKLYSENAPLSPLADTPYFEDTGKRIPAGFTELHVWKILDESVFSH